MFAFYADENMTTEAVQPLPVTYTGVQAKDYLLYYGSPNTHEKLVPNTNGGVSEIILTPANFLEDWAAGKAYGVGELIQPTTPNGLMYRCTVAGISGDTEPGWNTTAGGATITGSASFVNAGARFLPTDMKLALSAAGLDSAIGGGGLSLGASLVGGAAVAVHMRMNNPSGTLRGDDTDPCVGITINDCIETTTS